MLDHENGNARVADEGGALVVGEDGDGALGDRVGRELGAVSVLPAHPHVQVAGVQVAGRQRDARDGHPGELAADLDARHVARERVERSGARMLGAQYRRNAT